MVRTSHDKCQKYLKIKLAIVPSIPTREKGNKGKKQLEAEC